MMQDDDTNDDVGDISNRKMLAILMQEIADVRNELKEDIGNLDRKLSNKIDSVDQKLTKRMDALSSDFQTIRIEVHQNQATFIRNHDALEARVTTLETAA